MARAAFGLFYWGPVLAWAGLIVYLSSIPGLASGLPSTTDLVLRKLGHVGEYAVLTALLWRALRASGASRRTVILGSAIAVLLFAASDELHQSTVPGREGAVRDVLIDAVGMALGLALPRSLRRIRDGSHSLARASIEEPPRDG